MYVCIYTYTSLLQEASNGGTQLCVRIKAHTHPAWWCDPKQVVAAAPKVTYTTPCCCAAQAFKKKLLQKAVGSASIFCCLSVG